MKAPKYTEIRVWTELGRRHKEEEVQLLHLDFQEQNRAIEGKVSLSSSPEQASDRSAAIKDRTIAYTRWTDAQLELTTIRIAPQPRDKRKGKVGLKARIRWIEHADTEKEGTEETFIIGGIGETWEVADVRVVGCDQPLAQALINHEPGDEANVGKGVIEIISFSIPDFNGLRTQMEAQYDKVREAREAHA